MFLLRSDSPIDKRNKDSTLQTDTDQIEKTPAEADEEITRLLGTRMSGTVEIGGEMVRVRKIGTGKLSFVTGPNRGERACPFTGHSLSGGAVDRLEVNA